MNDGTVFRVIIFFTHKRLWLVDSPEWKEANVFVDRKGEVPSFVMSLDSEASVQSHKTCECLLRKGKPRVIKDCAKEWLCMEEDIKSGRCI